MVFQPGRKATILVVEDDPMLRSFYKSALMLGGYTVLTAGDGIEALRHIDGYQPSAVVLDLGLPRLSGPDVGRELASHENLRGIPIVVVTGSDAPVDEREFPCVLRKPVTADALIEAVDNCLRQSQRPANS